MNVKIKGLRLWCQVFVVAALLASIFSAVVFADGWKASDDGNDDPDGVHDWYAPYSISHKSEWWDIDQPGAMDQVRDWNMIWDDAIQSLFSQHPTNNLVHEVRTGNTVYEANDWYWTDLPTPDKNEDSWEGEELSDGYEEKELGWASPFNQIPGGVARQVYTGYNSLNNGNTYFESESELTAIWILDDWYPVDQDLLGFMTVVGAD